MANIKIERLNHTYQQEISKILMTEIKDQDIKFVTITDVTNDLSFAKVYFTVFEQEKIKDTTIALNDAAPFIRHCLAETVDVRHTPELKFIYDESIEYGNHIEEIINNLNKKESDI